jgi:GAF domain-containing protein
LNTDTTDSVAPIGFLHACSGNYMKSDMLWMICIHGIRDRNALESRAILFHLANMPEPLTSPMEPMRLLRMQSLGLFSIQSMPFLDSSVAETALTLNVEMAAVALVLEHEQVFVATHGLNAKRGSRGAGLCTHAMVEPERALIIPDALYDARTMDSPLVLAAPFIRSYAGRPLCLEPGFAIGTLCVCGLTPRHFTAEEQRRLDRMASLILREIRSFMGAGQPH